MKNDSLQYGIKNIHSLYEGMNISMNPHVSILLRIMFVSY